MADDMEESSSNFAGLQLLRKADLELAEKVSTTLDSFTLIHLNLGPSPSSPCCSF